MYKLRDDSVTTNAEVRFKKPWKKDGDYLIPQTNTKEKYKVVKVIESSGKDTLFECKYYNELWYIGLREKIENTYDLIFLSEYQKRIALPAPSHYFQAYVVKRKDEDKRFALISFKHMLEKHGIIGSDTEQTELGFRYWKKLIEKYSSLNCYYCIDTSSDIPKALEPKVKTLKVNTLIIPVKVSGGKIVAKDSKYNEYVENMLGNVDSFLLISKNKIQITIDKVI